MESSLTKVEDSAKRTAIDEKITVYVYRWGGLSQRYGETDTRKYYRDEIEICYFTPDGVRHNAKMETIAGAKASLPE